MGMASLSLLRWFDNLNVLITPLPRCVSRRNIQNPSMMRLVILLDRVPSTGGGGRMKDGAEEAKPPHQRPLLQFTRHHRLHFKAVTDGICLQTEGTSMGVPGEQRHCLHGKCSSLKSDRLWDLREVGCCSALLWGLSGWQWGRAGGSFITAPQNSGCWRRLPGRGQMALLPARSSSGKEKLELLDSRRSCAVAPHVGEAVNEEI